MPYPDNPVKMVRSCCEGENVLKNAFSNWDIESQEWVLFDTYDKGSFCEDCEDETGIEEVDIELPPKADPALPDPAGEAKASKPDAEKTWMVTDCCSSDEALRDAYGKWDIPNHAGQLAGQLLAHLGGAPRIGRIEALIHRFGKRLESVADGGVLGDTDGNLNSVRQRKEIGRVGAVKIVVLIVEV